jgi:hypothetical protein
LEVFGELFHVGHGTENSGNGKEVYEIAGSLRGDLKLPEHSWGVDSGGDSHFH